MIPQKPETSFQKQIKNKEKKTRHVNTAKNVFYFLIKTNRFSRSENNKKKHLKKEQRERYTQYEKKNENIQYIYIHKA